MQLLVASRQDPAGYNMALALTSYTSQANLNFYKGKLYDLLLLDDLAIYADWIEKQYAGYDGYVFLSKHVSASGTPALTSHSTGNFTTAKFGGKDRHVTIPHAYLHKIYMRNLWNIHYQFAGFDITIEATHHGPTMIDKPLLFIEIGSTKQQWHNYSLCSKIAHLVNYTLEEYYNYQQYTLTNKNESGFPIAICFGGTHYSKKFTDELIHGKYAVGTVIAKHSLEFLDKVMLDHIMSRNPDAKVALVDWSGLGKEKENVIGLIRDTPLELVKL